MTAHDRQLGLFHAVAVAEDAPVRLETVAPVEPAPRTAPRAASAPPKPRSTTTITSATPALRPQSRTRLLVDAIQAELGRGVKVVLTDNRSTLLSQAEKNGVRTVRVHQMFLDAPPPVRAALAHYLRHGDGPSGRAVDAFVDDHSHILQLCARPLAEGAHRGRVHDLLPLYAAINSAYFQDRIQAEIGWGQAGTPWGKSRRSITFGSYDARAQRITMHPVLDQSDVPSLCVARVVHHEMLHAWHREERDGQGRRVVHGPLFKRDEALFHGAREADAWFDKHLDRLLRFRLA